MDKKIIAIAAIIGVGILATAVYITGGEEKEEIEPNFINKTSNLLEKSVNSPEENFSTEAQVKITTQINYNNTFKEATQGRNITVECKNQTVCAVNEGILEFKETTKTSVHGCCREEKCHIGIGGTPTGCKIEEKTAEDAVFSSSIYGCAETPEGRSPPPKTGLGGRVREPRIRSEENQIRYSRSLNHLCCMKVEVNKSVEEPKINISEYWNGTACRCECHTEVSATLEEVPPGNYTVNVYRTGMDPEKNKTAEPTLLTTKEVNLAEKKTS